MVKKPPSRFLVLEEGPTYTTGRVSVLSMAPVRGLTGITRLAKSQ